MPSYKFGHFYLKGLIKVGEYDKVVARYFQIGESRETNWMADTFVGFLTLLGRSVHGTLLRYPEGYFARTKIEIQEKV